MSSDTGSETGDFHGQGHGHVVTCVCLTLPILVTSWTLKSTAVAAFVWTPLAFHIP